MVWGAPLEQSPRTLGGRLTIEKGHIRILVTPAAGGQILGKEY